MTALEIVGFASVIGCAAGLAFALGLGTGGLLVVIAVNKLVHWLERKGLL